jgi:hypothetical protein
VRIVASDIAGRTVGEILAAKGYLEGNAELIAAYDDMAERYDWRARYGEQFSGRAPASMPRTPPPATGTPTGRARTW